LCSAYLPSSRDLRNHKSLRHFILIMPLSNTTMSKLNRETTVLKWCTEDFSKALKSISYSRDNFLCDYMNDFIDNFQLLIRKFIPHTVSNKYCNGPLRYMLSLVLFSTVYCKKDPSIGSSISACAMDIASRTTQNANFEMELGNLIENPTKLTDWWGARLIRLIKIGHCPHRS